MKRIILVLLLIFAVVSARNFRGWRFRGRLNREKFNQNEKGNSNSGQSGEGNSNSGQSDEGNDVPPQNDEGNDEGGDDDGDEGAADDSDCVCKRWELLTNCLTTTESQELDEWLKERGIEDPAAFHACAQEVLDASEEPSSLLEAWRILRNIAKKCKIFEDFQWNIRDKRGIRGFWNRRRKVNRDEEKESNKNTVKNWFSKKFWNNKRRNFVEFWKICKQINEGGNTLTECQLQMPVAQQASADPPNFFTFNSTGERDGYKCSTVDSVNLPGGCEICPKPNGQDLCASACDHIFGKNLLSSSCIQDPNSNSLQTCQCTFCPINSCPGGSDERINNCYSYQPEGFGTTPGSASRKCNDFLDSRYHTPNVITKDQWDGLIEFVEDPATGYPQDLPFWLGANRENFSEPWFWFMNNSIVEADPENDYFFADNFTAIWAPGQPDNDISIFNVSSGLVAACALDIVFCPKAAIVAKTPNGFKVFDDFSFGPEDEDGNRLAPGVICQSARDPPIPIDFEQMWTDHFGSPFEPPTNDQPEDPSKPPYCIESNNDDNPDNDVDGFGGLYKCWPPRIHSLIKKWKSSKLAKRWRKRG